VLSSAQWKHSHVYVALEKLFEEQALGSGTSKCSPSTISSGHLGVPHHISTCFTHHFQWIRNTLCLAQHSHLYTHPPAKPRFVLPASTNSRTPFGAMGLLIMCGTCIHLMGLCLIYRRRCGSSLLCLRRKNRDRAFHHEELRSGATCEGHLQVKTLKLDKGKMQRRRRRTGLHAGGTSYLRSGQGDSSKARSVGHRHVDTVHKFHRAFSSPENQIRVTI
jgi:hypothetical protein